MASACLGGYDCAGSLKGAAMGCVSTNSTASYLKGNELRERQVTGLDQRKNALYSRIKDGRFERAGAGKDRLVLGGRRASGMTSTVKECTVANNIEHV